MELLIALFELFVQIPNVRFAFDDVIELRRPYFLLHCIKQRSDFIILSFHDLLLRQECFKELHFTCLVLLEVTPELLLDSLKFLESEVKELPSCYLLLLVKVLPQLQLLFHVSDGGFEVLHQTLELGYLSLCVILKHLDLVPLMIFETGSAERGSVIEAEIHILLLVLMTEVSVSITVSHRCDS